MLFVQGLGASEGAKVRKLQRYRFSVYYALETRTILFMVLSGGKVESKRTKEHKYGLGKAPWKPCHGAHNSH